MKSILSIISIVLFSIVTISCNPKSEKKDIDTKKEIPIEKSTYKINDVLLDNGSKWKANFETTEGIKKMQQILNTFSAENSLSNYIALKDNLETEFTTVFQKCTMTGESHNQLHNYLKPMLSMFKGLESSDIKIREENLNILKIHLGSYKNYFE